MAVLVVALSGCPPDERPRVGEQLVVDPPETAEGDPVGLFHITALRAERADPEVWGSYHWFGWATFVGEVELSGRYFDFQTDPDVRGPANPCFEVDDEHTQHLPRFPGDDRHAWFCFTDRDESILELGQPTPEGRFTSVVISEYRYRHEPTDVVNLAVLAEVDRRRGHVLPEDPPGLEPDLPNPQ